MGEKTPRIQEFIESREQLNSSLVRLKEQLQTEAINAKHELLNEKDKESSAIYRELSAITENIQVELGFTRSPQVEISREDAFNAFVLQVAKEGMGFDKASVPLRVFINAGFISRAQEILKKEGKTLSRDHVAFLIGHELRHLKQPGYHIDKPPKDKNEQQRYEYDADMAALDAMDRAGYNPKAGIEILEILLSSEKALELANHYIRGTHPLTENRIKELWREYARPDRPFFSAEKPFEPFHEEVFREADILIRKELKQQLENVTSLQEWEAIIKKIEIDPNSSINDIELVGKELKKHLDARASIAGALFAFEHETGITKAMLYWINYLFKDKKFMDVGVSPMNLFKGNLLVSVYPGYRLGSADSDTIKKTQKLIDSVIETESHARLKEEFDESQRRIDSEKEEEVFNFVVKHFTNEEIIDKPHFTSIKDLFDATNDETVAFWISVAKQAKDLDPTSRVYEALHKFSTTTLDDPTIRAELMHIVRNKVLSSLSMAIYYGIHFRLKLVGEEAVQRREQFLINLENFKKSQTQAYNDELSGSQTIGTSNMGFNFKKMEELKQYVERRVSVYRKQETLNPFTGIPYTRREYSLAHHLLNSPQRIPVTSFAIRSSIDEHPNADQIKTPLQRTLDAYFYVARKIWSAELDSKKIYDRFHTKVKTDEASKELLFKDIVVRHFFDSQKDLNKMIEQMTIEKVRSMPELITLLRLLPSHHWKKEVVRDEYEDFHFSYPGFLKITLGDEENEQTLEQLNDKLQIIRHAYHHPEIIRFLVNRDHIFTGENLPIQEYIKRGNDPILVKKRLFEKFLQMVQESTFPNINSGSNEHQIKINKKILEQRALAQNLPENFFLRRSDQRKMKSILDTITFISSYLREDASQRERAINDFFSLEFMRLMCDDQAEMNLCDMDTIKLEINV